MTIQSMPSEVFYRCLSFLDYPTLCTTERVSRAWHQAAAVDREYDFDLVQLERLKTLAQDKRLTVLIETPMLMENWIAKRKSFEPAPLSSSLFQAMSKKEVLSVKFLLQFEGCEPRDLHKAFAEALLEDSDVIRIDQSLIFLWNLPAFQEYITLGWVPKMSLRCVP